jgi:hypothetical protein
MTVQTGDRAKTARKTPDSSESASQRYTVGSEEKAIQPMARPCLYSAVRRFS